MKHIPQSDDHIHHSFIHSSLSACFPELQHLGYCVTASLFVLSNNSSGGKMVTMDVLIPLGHSIPADTHHVCTTPTHTIQYLHTLSCLLCLGLVRYPRNYCFKKLVCRIWLKHLLPQRPAIQTTFTNKVFLYYSIGSQCFVTYMELKCRL